jgi:hypothetical protein
MDERVPFMMGRQTKNEQAEHARKVLMDTVRQFRAEGPSEEDLAAAAKNITGGFPLLTASNSSVVSYLAMIGFYDLPLDHLDTFVERVSAVTKEQIRDALNQAGALATGKCLEDFDADGSPIMVAGEKLTAKTTKVPKDYESPYGAVSVPRYCYQGTQGGEGYFPLEASARIIGGTTPRFARIVSFNYAHDNAAVTQSNLKQTLRRDVSRCFIQDISILVANQVEDKSRHWDYAQSEPMPHEVAFVSIGIDGTCLLFCEEGHRQAMVGTIAFYDADGERLHTNYIGAAPEYGKATFLRRMDEEINRVKARYGQVRYVGISDGATDYLSWLKQHTTTQVLDFWHVTEYITAAAPAIHRKKADRKKWIEDACHNLKHKHGAALQILDQLQLAATRKLSVNVEESLNAAISYFQNNLDRMNYASYRKSQLPIGSGITEAACKSLVKTRMCGSGMQWVQRGADCVLTLRALALTPSRWDQFWDHLSKFGLTAPRTVK